MKIGIIIPATSNKRDYWKSIKDTYLYNICVKTFISSITTKEKTSLTFCFYIGFDNDDRIFADPKEQETIHYLSKVFPFIQFKFITLENIKKGHVTKMWNVLFQKAYDDQCDYFYQCGDDIAFKTKEWITDSINMLKRHSDLGLTGPINNNPKILTQSFVSRKHMDIFGFYFPEEILNWFCDDWYNEVYKPNHFYPLSNHFCSNDGGDPRYVVNHDEGFYGEHFKSKFNDLKIETYQYIDRDRKIFESYLKRIKKDVQ
jgi:hypothetical protein